MAKSGIYKVYLKSMLWGKDAQGGSSGWGEGTMYVIGQEIRKLMLQVTANPASTFAGADYSWEVKNATVQPHEVLIYFLNSGKSLITEFGNETVTSAGGTFMVNDGVISEVHVDKVDGDPHFAEKLARLAFHELLHNKLDADPNNSAVPDLHKTGAGGLALHNVDWNTQLMKPTETLLAQNLTRKIKQFTKATSRTFYMDQ